MSEATDGQKLSVLKTLKGLGVPEGAVDWVLARLLEQKGHEIEAREDLTAQQWREFRAWAFPRWREDDWTVGDIFRAAVATVGREYESQVHGQGDMFDE